MMRSGRVQEDRVNKKPRENLYNREHIVPSEKYRQNYDRIFRKDREDAE